MLPTPGLSFPLPLRQHVSTSPQKSLPLTPYVTTCTPPSPSQILLLFCIQIFQSLLPRSLPLFFLALRIASDNLNVLHQLQLHPLLYLPLPLPLNRLPPTPPTPHKKTCFSDFPTNSTSETLHDIQNHVIVTQYNMLYFIHPPVYLSPFPLYSK